MKKIIFTLAIIGIILISGCVQEETNKIFCPSSYQEINGKCLLLCPDEITFTNDWRNCPPVNCTPPTTGCSPGFVCSTDYKCVGQCGPAVECGDGLCTPWCETIDDCPSDCGFLE